MKFLRTFLVTDIASMTMTSEAHRRRLSEVAGKEEFIVIRCAEMYWIFKVGMGAVFGSLPSERAPGNRLATEEYKAGSSPTPCSGLSLIIAMAHKVMSACPHWIWQSGESQPGIAVSRRLEEVTSSISPGSAAPSLVILVDYRNGSLKGRTSRKQPGDLTLDFVSEGSGEPFLLGTTSFIVRRTRGGRCRLCVPEHEVSIPGWDSFTETEDFIYSQLLYPFVDVFCFYSYSVVDLESLARRVASWVHGGTHNRLGDSPRLVVVLQGDHWQRGHADVTAEIRFTNLLSDLGVQHWDQFFSDVDFLLIPNSDTFSNLRPYLDQHVLVSRRSREEAQSLFTLEHFKELFSRAMDASRNQPSYQFDIIKATRRDFPVTSELAVHLNNFLGYIELAEDLRPFGALVIASALLMDHFTADMHRIHLPFLLKDI